MIDIHKRRRGIRFSRMMYGVRISVTITYRLSVRWPDSRRERYGLSSDFARQSMPFSNGDAYAPFCPVSNLYRTRDGYFVSFIVKFIESLRGLNIHADFIDPGAGRTRHPPIPGIKLIPKAIRAQKLDRKTFLIDDGRENIRNGFPFMPVAILNKDILVEVKIRIAYLRIFKLICADADDAEELKILVAS